MPHFHFDLVDGAETIRDEEGIDAQDLADASADAATVIEDMRASGELDETFSRLLQKSGFGFGVEDFSRLLA